jgi:shikimate dehydrogenase
MQAAVLGSPVSHSLSPVLHNAAYRALGLDHTYSAIETAESELGSFLGSVDSNWLGVSLTMPLKEVAFDYADTCDELSTLTGAINTLVFGTEVSAFNTDVLGLVDALAEAGSKQISTGVVFALELLPDQLLSHYKDLAQPKLTVLPVMSLMLNAWLKLRTKSV